jgi:hypothetical protein
MSVFACTSHEILLFRSVLRIRDILVRIRILLFSPTKNYYVCLMIESSGSGSVPLTKDPDPGGPKTYGSSGSRSATCFCCDNKQLNAPFISTVVADLCLLSPFFQYVIKILLFLIYGTVVQNPVFRVPKLFLRIQILLFFSVAWKRTNKK